MNSFKSYIEASTPLPWVIIDDHPTEWLIGNDARTMNLVGYGLIIDTVKKYFPFNGKVLDVGVYPGTVPQIFHEYLKIPMEQKYYGVGMGFSSEFIKKMQGYGVTLLECDLDPRLHLSHDREARIPMDDSTVDSILFTDVIEHLYDPFYTLKEINRVSKMGAIMILTTDNLTRWGSFLKIIRGQSCNVPLISGNLFYDGDWRPHFREYSRDEIFQLLDWSGFEVVDHQFYEAQFGKYRVIDGRLFSRESKELSLKGKIKKSIQNFARSLFPHLCDNHIIVAKKIKSYQNMNLTAPKIVSNNDLWIEQRREYESQ
jgi:SAM-dependent methyltransferase